MCLQTISATHMLDTKSDACKARRLRTMNPSGVGVEGGIFCGKSDNELTIHRGD